MEDKITEAVDLVEGLCAPDLMTKAEAIEFLQEVIDRLYASIESLREEIADEEEN
jgi:hypothetical protein